MEIRFGVIGVGYGGAVLIPAIRCDPRARVLAVAAGHERRAKESAVEHGIPKAFGDWQRLVADAEINALAVAVPPGLQPQIIEAAAARGLPVFAEKPLAATLDAAERAAQAVAKKNLANAVDFNFSALAAFIEAKRKVNEGATGRIHHISVRWHVESYANRKRLVNWKTMSELGGGTLHNFVSHSLHYVEWLAGPIATLSAKLTRHHDDSRSGDTGVMLTLEFENGASGSLSMNAAAHAGTGHQIEIYGEAGTLVLVNGSPDHMQEFRLLRAGHDEDRLREIPVAEPVQENIADSRIAPTSRLLSRFIDSILGGPPLEQNVEAALRVQHLLDAALQSDRKRGWISVLGRAT